VDKNSNSGTSGQLTDEFRIPTYAQDMLFIVTGEGSSQAQGKQGKYTLDSAPQETVRLTWGASDGPALAYWSETEWPTARWDGRVKIGGFVERLHARELGGLEVVIIEVVGGLLPANHVGLPSLNDMRNGIFARPSDSEPFGTDQSYPFVILAESNLSGIAQDALVSGLAVDAYGSLASEAGRWHELVGLPLLLDSLTLLAP
jgi:hypothetical protein